MFALEVGFLTQRYYATDYKDRAKAEWPPHPDRLFSALVAAAAATEEGLDAYRNALGWLERQPPPSISHAKASPRDAFVVFVPVNDVTLLDIIPARRSRQPRFLPSHALQDPRVYYIWPAADPDPATCETLARCAAGVTRLGSSASLVCVSVCEAPPKTTFAPDEDGNTALRVVAEGRLKDLEMRYDGKQRPKPGPLVFYKDASSGQSPVDSSPASAAPLPGAFEDMLVFRKINGPTLPIQAAMKLAEATRSAAMSLAANPLPAALHGHTDDKHVAFAALPFVGSRHADGHLMGVAALLPSGLDPAARRAVFKALVELKDIKLGALGVWEVERLVGEHHIWTLKPATWRRPARVWTTATPLILDRFPKKNLCAEKIVAKGCERAGLPIPIVELSRYARLTGAPPSWEFPNRRKDTEPRRLTTHATLTFDQPVRGPLLLGAGRFFGLGLFLPLDD